GDGKGVQAIGGRSLLGHVLAAIGQGPATAVAIVIGPGQDGVAAAAKALLPGAEIFVQAERRGTAHAALAARPAIARGADEVLIVFGDTPLISAATLARLRGALAGQAVAGLGVRPGDPTGDGGLVSQGGRDLA